LTDRLQEYLRAKQAQVENRLRQILDQEVGCPDGLKEAMAYSLLAPGKRLRPTLVIMAAEAAGGNDRMALAAACAVEMVHAYSLIHDDLPAMDDDDLRRGLPTCHRRFGEALAILAGDALLTLAFQVLADNYPPATAAGCCRELARGAGPAGMVGGQVEDLAWEQTGRDPGISRVRSLSALENIHSLKTGSLFRACLRMGVWTTQGEWPKGPNPEIMQRLDGFGRCFGLVFQITDDLLDVEGTVEATGKTVHKDAARGKLTFPGLLGVEESRRRASSLAYEAKDLLRPLGDGTNNLLALLEFVLCRTQ
jgi:geranylgeranyl diphosphate synthase type II